MLENKHSGRLRPHRHTSYAGLLFVLILGFVLLTAMSLAAEAAPANPQSGSIGLQGVVPGPAPSTTATILVPSSGSTTNTSPITVSGVCPAGSYATITKNNVFAGSVACADNGTFTLQVDLFDGSNTLVSQAVNALGETGPDSAPVIVYYNAPTLTLPGGESGRQLFLQMSTPIVGGQPNVSITRTATIVGGVGPYAAEWDWGDGDTSLTSIGSEGNITASHTYTRPGTYAVILRVTDSASNSAYLQFVTVVNGPVASLGSTNTTGAAALPGTLIGSWPLLLLAAFMVAFFWLGERMEVRKLRRQHLLVQN
jgi:PKD domain-containing protein/glucodextranase-like protein